MRIIHISDLHAGAWLEAASGYFDKRFLGATHFCLRRRGVHDWSRVTPAVQQIRSLSPDLVVCTGDLASVSQASEFRRATDALMDLVNDSRFEFIYVPGNHDAYVRDAGCVEALQRTFHTLNRERWQLEELPQTLDIGPVRLLIVNESLPTGLLSARGKICAKTESVLRQELDAPEVSDGRRRLILIAHYPLADRSGAELTWLRRCENNEFLVEALRQGKISLSLCGHIHRGFRRDEPSGGTEVCAGSLTSEGRFSVVDFNAVENRVTQRWLDVIPGDTPAEPPLEVDAGIAAS